MNASQPSRDGLRQGAVLLLAITQCIAPLFYVLAGIGTDIGSRARESGAIPFVPAGYAFSIWGYLYLASLVYAVYQLFPKQRVNPLMRDTGWWMAATFGGATAWVVVAQVRNNLWTLGIIVGMLACLAMAYRRLLRDTSPGTMAERVVFRVMLRMYIGWVSLAVFANLASMLKKYGFSNFGLSEPHWTMLMLLCAGGTVATVTYRSRGDAWYALAVIWGLLAILIRNLTEFSYPQVALTAAGMILVVLAMIPLGHCGSNTSQQNEPEPGNAA